jgi:hypothetical protein
VVWKPIVGLALNAAAIATRSYAEPWFQPGRTVAIHQPISLVSGHISSTFVAGYAATYRVGIDFEAPEELPFKKPNCIPAPYFPPDDCSGIPSNLNISWVLSSGEQIIQRGSASPTIWNRSGSTFLAFVNPHLESGRVYKLEVDILNDGSQFTSARPRLSVHVHQPEFGESLGMTAMLTRLGYGTVGLVGLGLLIAAFLGRSQNFDTPQRARINHRPCRAGRFPSCNPAGQTPPVCNLSAFPAKLGSFCANSFSFFALPPKYRRSNDIPHN